MIISEILLKNNGKPKVIQDVTIKCDDCDKVWQTKLYTQIKGIKNYGRDLCRGCKQREQIKLGIRSKEQYTKAGEGYVKKHKGKKIEEICGEEKGKELREIASIRNKGENNPMYGKNAHTHGLNKFSKSQLGKTYEELYGEVKAMKLKKNLSVFNKGKNNSMYGKPSPTGSGNGWSGWYNGWYFRSLLELSFMVNVIERFGFKWVNGESNKYKIKYIDENNQERNYFSDFILNGKYMIEIKPKKLQKTIRNKQKEFFAIEYCNNNDMVYKMIDTVKRLTFDELNKLVINNRIKFLDRYKIKFEEWKKKEK